MPCFHLLRHCLIQSLREIHQTVSEVLLGLSPSTTTICHHVPGSHSSPRIMTYTEHEQLFQNLTLLICTANNKSRCVLQKPSFLCEEAWKTISWCLELFVLHSSAALAGRVTSIFQQDLEMHTQNSIGRPFKMEIIVPKPLDSTRICCSWLGRIGGSRAASYHQRPAGLQK